MGPRDILLRDVNDSLGRTRLSTRSAEDTTHCAAAVLPSQKLMVFAPGHPYRLLFGREALALQGFPSGHPSLSELIEETSESLMADLAGNMVSTPIMLTLAMVAISSVSWRQTPRAQASTTAEACEAAWSQFLEITAKPALGEPPQKRQRR